MNDKGDFKEQSTNNLQKAVRSGRLSLPDYYEKQSGLKSAEYRGVDDGTSCVRGTKIASKYVPARVKNRVV